MRVYSCKCRKTEKFTLLTPYPCDKCVDCGSNLAPSHADNGEPQPHSWTVFQVMTDEGYKPLTKCNWCGVLKNA